MSDDASAPLDLAALVEVALRGRGIAADRELVDSLAEDLEAVAHVEAARIVGGLLAQLPPTPGGESVARFLLNDHESVNSAARRIGCAPSSLLRASKRLRRFLGF